MAGRTPPKPRRPFDLDFTPMRKLRLYQEVTQGELARAAGVDITTIWRLERNHTVNPGFRALVAIGYSLGVPYHQLCDVVEPRKK